MIRLKFSSYFAIAFRCASLVFPFGLSTHVLKNNYQTNTDKTSEYYYGLAVGDKVILLRNQGGQAFLVLGRV